MERRFFSAPSPIGFGSAFITDRLPMTVAASVSGVSSFPGFSFWLIHSQKLINRAGMNLGHRKSKGCFFSWGAIILKTRI